MLISEAYAQAAGGGGSGDMMALIANFAPIIIIVVIFYMLLWRPQQKRMKEHREKLSNIRRGDRIVGNGGLIGTVTKAADDDDTITVEVADGVRVQMMRSMVSDVLGKGEPVSKPAKSKKSANDGGDDDAADKS